MGNREPLDPLVPPEMLVRPVHPAPRAPEGLQGRGGWMVLLDRTVLQVKMVSLVSLVPLDLWATLGHLVCLVWLASRVSEAPRGHAEGTAPRGRGGRTGCRE